MLKTEIRTSSDSLKKLLGPNDSNLRFIEERLNTALIVRESSILFDEKVEGLENILHELLRISRAKEYLDLRDVETVLRLYSADKSGDDTGSGDIVLNNAHALIKTRSANQDRYLAVMNSSELVFAIGPAGTGKTFLAVAWAVSLFEKRIVDRIVLVRPVVEAGEKLGFLPGDIKEKVDPYFRPLYDALFYMLPGEKTARLIEHSVIEVAPLAFMRGRTLNRSIVILDEAQNTSAMQMKMFLTRLGQNSRAIITGDMTQIDLANPEDSGLASIKKILEGVEGISFVYLDSTDVVRHKLVSEIIKAYDKYNNGKS